MNENPLFTGLEVPREPLPFALVIFGVTGDLTSKKLMPALFSLFLKGHISRFRIIGFARRPWTSESFREEAARMIDRPEFASEGDGRKNDFLSHLEYIPAAFEDREGYKLIDGFSDGFPGRLYYLSTPPSSYNAIIDNIGSLGLAKRTDGFTRIIVEKPFGKDLETARALNARLSQFFDESQIYRIDHYLGKETVQNIMVLRFGNGLFEPVWNNRYVDHVQITVAEKIGVGTRGNYYEGTGALRDMVQNHVFQLLTLTAMEPPASLEPDSIRSEKVKVLKALRPITHKEIPDCAVRARYERGVMDGKEIKGYLEEDGIAPASRTETFVALKLLIDSWRWAGVPFYIRSGKRLSRRTSEISVHFKQPPHRLFTGTYPTGQKNTLIMRIQPDEGIAFNFNAKTPGYSIRIRPVNMDFSYGSAFGDTPPEAYERLLLDAFLGDSTLYTRRDEIETSWEFITRIIRGWEADERPLASYRGGTSGPEEAKLLMDAGRRWRRL